MPSPTVRGSGFQAAVASSYVIAWPAGTVAGDLAIIIGTHKAVVTLPSGWLVTMTYNTAGATPGTFVVSKVLTPADITAGSITITTASSNGGTFAIVTVVGQLYAIMVSYPLNGSVTPAVRPIVARANARPADLAVYYGANFAVSVNTIDRGVQAQAGTDGVGLSAVLSLDTGHPPGLTNFYFGTPGAQGFFVANLQVGLPFVPTAARWPPLAVSNGGIYVAPPFLAGLPASGSIRFILNGQQKTANIQVTGADLWKIAGYPKTLMRGSLPVPNTNAYYDLAQDQVLTATY